MIVDIDFILFAISEKTSQIKTCSEDGLKMLKNEREELIRIAAEYYERDKNRWRKENTELR
jgi:hypothetical protein